MSSLSSKPFQNDFVSHFPGDQSGDLYPRPTPGVFYSKVLPTRVSNPELLAWSDVMADKLDISKPMTSEEIGILAGNNISPTMAPYAACYGGHQFGNWAGQLGDGRALTLGEWVAPDNSIWELQLKGAGQTPYSRRADGRAVLRSSVREYLMSEAMHFLGVPTTRALSLVSTGDKVVRDMFYDGNPEPEPGAIVMRVAPSFLRFGNFELPAVRREIENLRNLVDWTIARYYPHLQDREDKIVIFFQEVLDRTANLMVEWMRVGFVHGVMNTDNMSILGLTIDYGPYSFLDDYDLRFTPNTTDLPGRRYAFGNQPGIGKWNLACLAGALSVLLTDTQPLADALEQYDKVFSEKYYAMMARKLGLDEIGDKEVALINRIDNMLSNLKPDMTLFYRKLIDLPPDASGEADIATYFKDVFYKEPDAKAARSLSFTIQAYIKRIKANKVPSEESKQIMRSSNPRFILRNYMLHNAIKQMEKGDYTLFNLLQEALKEPYSNKYDSLSGMRPDWAAQKAGCSMLSCSS